jgi:hypothetical protein
MKYNELLIRKKIKNLLLEVASISKIDELILKLEKLNNQLIEESKKFNLKTLDKKNCHFGYCLSNIKHEKTEEITFSLAIYEDDYFVRTVDMDSKDISFIEFKRNVLSNINTYEYSIEELNPIKDFLKSILSRYPVGSITIFDSSLSKSFNGNCSNTYMINFASPTTKGWGPLLYDVAIEIASTLSSGLLSDRSVVSNDAKNVWMNYYLNRPDVFKAPIDSTKNNAEEHGFKQITPSFKGDDCSIKSSMKHIDEELPLNFIDKKSIKDFESNQEKYKWLKSPLSYVYSKNSTTVIDRLKNLGIYNNE